MIKATIRYWEEGSVKEVVQTANCYTKALSKCYKVFDTKSLCRSSIISEN